MAKKIGFIGSGNMARSMIKGLISSNKVSADNIFVSNSNTKSLDEVKCLYSVNTLTKNTELAEISDIIFLCTKPDKYKLVSNEIDNYLKDDVIIISIAPGQTIEKVSSYFSKDVKVISSMPNTPSKVLAGMSAISINDKISEADAQYILSLFRSFGEAEIIDESLMNAIIAVSGSSPAFIFILIEAMADKAVSFGLPREKAYKFVANAVLGSAKMVLEDGSHVAKLKDDVCSPKGTTINGVLALEKYGFRNAIQEAMEEVYKKANEMN